jgi:hypothetical protein
MSSTVLFVFEGRVKEPTIFKSLKKTLLQSDPNTQYMAVFGAEIYQLWKKIDEDPFLDLVALLQARDDGLSKTLRRTSIAKVYLFFDHDGHARTDVAQASAAMEMMLKRFNEETQDGKLYISYPMVEALEDYPDYRECTGCMVYISENKYYKKNIRKKPHRISISKWGPDYWGKIVALHLLKAMAIVFGEFRYPLLSELKEIDQETIFMIQKRDHMDPGRYVISISGIALFLIDYLEVSFFTSITASMPLLECNLFCAYPKP